MGVLGNSLGRVIGFRGRWSWGWNLSHSHLGGVLVWNSPRREGVLPAGDKRGNWNVTWFPADVWPGLGMYFPRLRKRGLDVCPGLKRRELELGRRRFHRKRST